MLRRRAAGWTMDDAAAAAPAELASHIEVGLRLLHVSEPSREIAGESLAVGSFAEFGLDPPASVVAVNAAQGASATVNFGVLNPAGTSQYVRIGGSANVYLMARHVGSEWQVAADMARRLRAQAEPAVARRGPSLFLPVSMEQIWAVEIVFGGKLTRFERDSAGNWFRHVGGHSHAANTNAHVADPAQAHLIAAALAAFDTTAVETRVGRTAEAGQLAKFGLTYPAVIVLLYPRDSSTELARVEIRRHSRQPRSLRAAGSRWRGRDRCRVRGQAAHRSAQGGRSGVVMPRPLISVKAGIRRRLWDWVPHSAGTSAKLRCVFALIVVVAIAVGGAAQAHQVNLSTARVELRPDRTVAVEIALKGSDADRLAGTQIYDAQKDFADPAKVAASAASIAGYVSAHTDVTGTDGKACARGTAQVVPDGDGVIVRNVFSCRNVAGDLVYRSTVLTASDRSARQVVLIGAGENAPQALLDDAHTTLTISAPAPSLWSTMQRYLVTGIEHIFLGYDHIAFLVAIVLWARRLCR